jgi:hypothetical protein
MTYRIRNESPVYYPCSGKEINVDLRCVFWFLFSHCDPGRECYICVFVNSGLGIGMLLAFWEGNVLDELWLKYMKNIKLPSILVPMPIATHDFAGDEK